jgi:hypothetical protein
MGGGVVGFITEKNKKTKEKKNKGEKEKITHQIIN